MLYGSFIAQHERAYALLHLHREHTKTQQHEGDQTTKIFKAQSSLTSA